MVYLATTGLSNIWETDSKFLLLGNWCVYSKKNRELLKGKDYSIVPSPWKPAGNVLEDADFCYKVYQKTLPKLCDSLNSIHNLDFPVKYWEVIVSHWLLSFIEILFARYRGMEMALELYPDLHTNVLSKENCLTASQNTHTEATLASRDDYHNLQLYSLVAHELCKEKINIIEFAHDISFNKTPSNWKIQGYDIATNLVNKVFDGRVLLKQLHNVLTPLQGQLLNVRSFFDIVSIFNYPLEEQVNSSGEEISKTMREQFRMEEGREGFESFLLKTLPFATPFCFVERFKKNRGLALELTEKDNFKLIGATGAWKFAERFKVYAAEMRMKGAKLVEFQHGGGFGYTERLLHEECAVETKDAFYSWGWEKEGNDKIQPLPSPYLSQLSDSHEEKNDSILMVGHFGFKYIFKVHPKLFPDDVPKYLNDKKRLFLSLKPELAKKLLYRSAKINEEWYERDVAFVKDVCPFATFAGEGKLTDLMKKSKLVVIDHPLTSMLEALTINVPCILFWDHESILFRPEAEKTFQILRDAGILYRNPEDAAKKINAIYESPTSWWKQEHVQKARKQFCKKYAYVEKKWIEIWRKEFDSLIKEA